jgi:DNA-directed RNA polymerase specialized sigma24 family protein
MAQGMPESSAYRALKQGWYCPGYNQRDYPQHDGAGGFAILETPERFVRAYVLRTLAQWEMAPSPELVEDLTQDGLLACWTRRHAPHIENFPRYYAAMLRGLVTQHCKRLRREQAQLVPLQDTEARRAVRD